jgi:hypothetical protein
LVVEDIDAHEVFARAEAAGYSVCADIPRDRERAHEVGFWIAPSGSDAKAFGVASAEGAPKRVFWVEGHAFDARLLVVVAGADGDLSVPPPFDALRLFDAEQATEAAERATGAERPRALLRAIVASEGQLSPRLCALLDAALEGGPSVRRAALFGATCFRHETLERFASDAMARYPKGDERHDAFAAIRALEARKLAGEHTWDLETDDVRELTDKLSEAHAAGQHVRVLAAADRILAQRYEQTNAFALACRALARAARGELWHARVDAYAAEAVLGDGRMLPDAVRAALSALSARDVRELEGDAPAEAFAIVPAVAADSSADAAKFLERLRTLPRLGDARDLEFHARQVVAALASGVHGAYEEAKRLVTRKPKSRIAAGLVARAAPDAEREAALARYAELLEAAHEDAAFDTEVAELAERAFVTVREEDLLRDLLRLRQRAGAPKDELLARAERTVARVPNSALAWLDLGMMRTGVLLHADAVDAYTKAIELYLADEASGGVYFGGSMAVAWFNRACERTKCGDAEGALVDLAEACRRDAKYIAMAKGEEYFDPLRGDARFEAICEGELPEAPKTRGPVGAFEDALKAAKAATFRGAYDEALELAEEALEAASTDAQRVDALATVCFAATWASDVEHAIEAGREAAALADALASSGAADADRNLDEPHHMLAGALHAAGEHEEAEASYQKALAIRAQKHGPAHPVLAKSYGDLARLSSDRGRREEAIERAEKGVQILRDAAFGNEPIDAELREEALADLIILANNVLFLRRTGGEFDAALASAELAVAAYEAFAGSVFNAHILQSIANELGQIADKDPARLPQATALLARLEDRYARTPSAEPPEVQQARVTWARIVDNLARVHDEVSSDPAFLADMLQAAVLGEAPRPEVARVPGAAAALVQFGRLVATPGTTLIVLAPMTIDLLRSGTKSFAEVLDDLREIHLGYVANPTA